MGLQRDGAWGTGVGWGDLKKKKGGRSFLLKHISFASKNSHVTRRRLCLGPTRFLINFLGPKMVFDRFFTSNKIFDYFLGPKMIFDLKSRQKKFSEKIFKNFWRNFENSWQGKKIWHWKAAKYCRIFYFRSQIAITISNFIRFSLNFAPKKFNGVEKKRKNRKKSEKNRRKIGKKEKEKRKKKKKGPFRSNVWKNFL